MDGIIVGEKLERWNANKDKAMAEGAPNEYSFMFFSKGGYIYYSSIKNDINILASFKVRKIENNYIKNRFINLTIIKILFQILIRVFIYMMKQILYIISVPLIWSTK